MTRENRNTWPKKHIILYVDRYLSEEGIGRSNCCQLEIMKLMSQPDQNRVLFVWCPLCSWSV